MILPADAAGVVDGKAWWGTPWPFAGTFAGEAFDPRPLYIADARSGAIRELAANAVDSPTSYGRGGFYGDGDRFLVTILNGQQLELRGITPDGRSTLLRAFAKSDSAGDDAVHGDLVAWAIAVTDSVTVFAARGPTAGRTNSRRSDPPPRRSSSSPGRSTRRCSRSRANPAEPSLSVIHVDDAGAPRGAPVVLNPRATEPWSLRWTPDNRSLVLSAAPRRRTGRSADARADRSKEAPTFYGKNDEEPLVSPDGKRVAYPAARTIGATIWRADFPPGKVELSGKP